MSKFKVGDLVRRVKGSGINCGLDELVPFKVESLDENSGVIADRGFIPWRHDTKWLELVKLKKVPPENDLYRLVENANLAEGALRALEPYTSEVEISQDGGVSWYPAVVGPSQIFRVKQKREFKQELGGYTVELKDGYLHIGCLKEVAEWAAKFLRELMNGKYLDPYTYKPHAKGVSKGNDTMSWDHLRELLKLLELHGY